MKLDIPSDLVGRIQHTFVGSKYERGIFVVPTLKEEEVETILSTFFIWCKENGVMSNDGKVDINYFLEVEDRNGEEEKIDEQYNS
jgi:hypothetical protein